MEKTSKILVISTQPADPVASVPAATYTLQVVFMNPKPLVRHFPELEQLPPERQQAVLEKAHKEVTAPERRFETWRNNIFALAIITGLSLAIIYWLGPALNLARSTTAIVIMVVVLPAFIYIQQRRYIARLRPEIQRLVRQEQTKN